MNFSIYQAKARTTAVYPNIGQNLWYPGLGIAGEAGEVADKIKKIYRDHSGIASPTDRTELQKELGDVLWYIAAICSELKLDMNDVAENNLIKTGYQERKWNYSRVW